MTRPLPPLVSISDVAELLGVGKARADAISHKAGFPRSVPTGAGRIWRRSDVERWIATHRVKATLVLEESTPTERTVSNDDR